MNFLLVFFGGGIGCVLRYGIGLGFQKTAPSLPWATFLSNTLSCLIFAGVLWFIQNKELSGNNLKLLLLTGLCGGLSTFSTFGYETFLLLKQGMHLYALLNILISSVFCIMIFYVFS